jgi:hypothetical protein
MYEGFNSHSIEIVVARYKESIDWIKDYSSSVSSITIYNKSDTPIQCDTSFPNCKIIKLKNVGVCDHTYLYHIINNYDTLADITIFLPGSGSLENKKRRIDFVMSNVRDTKDTVIPIFKPSPTEYDFALDTYTLASKENSEIKNIKHHPSDIRPYGKWFDTYFKNSKMTHLTFNGIFAVSRADIQSRDKEFYISLLEQINTYPFHETSHYIERSWSYIFKGVKEKCLYNSTW